ncbi:MAG: archaetidylinositol phosphate synthase [Candidatus Bathyarchaeota archaeon]|nr:archaetidylinositol phosphate synthase [Candidatus Bathyarchaeota archaeon]
MVSSKLKKQFEATVKSAVTPLGKLGITPNMLTVLGGVLATVTGYLFFLVPGNRVFLVYAGVLITVSGLVDAVDGVLARSTGKVTRFGGFFDSVIDRYSDAVIYTGIIVAGLCNQVIGLVTLFASMLVSYTRARAEMEGVKMAGIGLAERAERMTFLSICSIMSFWYPPVLNYSIIILAVLALITVVQRITYFKKMIEKK